MIEINMDERNRDSVMITLREIVQNGNCRKIHIFEAGESPKMEFPTHYKDIREILKEIGIPCHIAGYKYIRDIIEILKKEPYKINKLVKEIYVEIAFKNKTTPSSVERAIRYAIEKVFTYGDSEEIYKYFGSSYSKDKGKPTNKEFIAMMTELIKQEDRNEN